MTLRISSIILLSFVLLSFTSDKPAYLIFDGEGNPSSYQSMLKMASEADVVLFGEFHDNPISHWLQYELSRDLLAAVGKDKLMMGAEMFETDGQLLLTEYVEKQISNKNFESQARLWPNYRTDYKPLVELARENGLSFIATNVPRRYASITSNSGFEGLEELDKDAKRLFAPLPITYDASLPAYQEMLEMSGAHGESNENFPKAQALKDATMAHFILDNWKKGQTFIHFNGAFHSDNYQGIYWYLKHYKKNINIMTISTVSQTALDTLSTEYLDKADFIIVVNENMTNTR